MDYIEYIKHRLQLYPELEPLLVKVMRTIDKRGMMPKQITLCACADVDHFNLMQLFTPAAIKTQNNRYIFVPARMTMVGIVVEPWLKAAAAVLGNYQITPKDDNVTLLLERLNMLFAELDSALEFLRGKRNIIKRKITELGKEAAFTHYKLCLAAVKFLQQNRELLTSSDLGVKICGDSKAFRAGGVLNNNTAELLAAELGCPPNESMTQCRIIDNPTSTVVTVYGPFIYYDNNGKVFDWIKQLWERGEAATLNAGNLAHIDKIELSHEVESLLSCENESPFNHLIRENNHQALIYTAGFPNSAVKKFITLLNANIDFLHWGDTDPEGLEIAAILNNLKPLQLYRCGAGEIERLKARLIPLSKSKIKRAHNLLKKPDFKFRKALKLTLEYSGWLEQESWQ